eukprot:SAG31_NODE_2555_length_5496_cov_13.099314_7_plen_88_part_00
MLEQILLILLDRIFDYISSMYLGTRVKAPEKQRRRALLEPLELEIPAVDIAQVRYRRYRPVQVEVQVRIPKTSLPNQRTSCTNDGTW